MAELENKYSRFYRDTGIDLHAEIAAGGSEGGLENYYTKPETDGLLGDKVDSADYSALEVRVADLEANPVDGGVTDHGALTGLADDDHTQYLNNTRGDIRYYTKAQVDTSLSSKSDTTHNHDDRYFTESEVNTLLSTKSDNTDVDAIDDRVTALENAPGTDLTNYYNKTETNGLLDGKVDDADLTAHTGNTSNPHGVTKAQVGLSNVDNTADTAKPISTATQTALDGKSDTSHNHDSRYYTETETDTLLAGKANSSHTHATADVTSGTFNIARIPTGTSGTTVALGNHSHTKTDVGLGNVDNTSDSSKPVSTAQQTALDGKQPLDSDLTAIAAIAPANDDIIQRKAGAWINRTPAQVKTDLALTKTDVGLANVDNTSDVNKPVSTATTTALNLKLDTAAFNTQTRPGYKGTPRAVKPSLPSGVDSAHSAFPGICKMANGNLIMVWRQGTDHVTSRDGSIKASTSSDMGRTWTAATTPVAYASDGVDYRDPSISLAADSSRLYLTYFKGTASLAAAGCFLRISTDNGQTWGSEIRIDSTLAYAAMSSPLLELANGNLLAFMYGKSGVETFDSVWYSRSTNNGSTWSAPTRLVNGATASTNYQEPWAVRSGSNTVVLYRWGASNIGKVSSTDATATTWGSGSSQFTGTGRPAAVWTSYGNLIVVYRAANGSTMTRYARTTDGTTWYPGSIMQVNLYGGMMTYACPFEVQPGQIICPWAEEIGAQTASRLLITYINQNGGDTPIGSIPNDSVALQSNYDNLVYATNFHQNDGGVTYPWQSGGGTVTVADGVLTSAAADNSPDSIVLNTGTQNQKVEGEFYWSGQSGYGLYLKWADVNNHWLLTTETGGTNLRIYKRVAGVLTQVAVVNDAFYTFENTWTRFWGQVNGKRIQIGINDKVVVEYGIGTVDANEPTQLVGTWAGLKVNNQSGGTTLCRKFMVSAL